MSNPFLMDEARNDPDHWPRFLDREIEFFEQRLLRRPFSGDIRRGVGRGEVWVARRVPLLVIGAVQDAGHTIGARAQQSFESIAVFGCLDFPRIRRADGRNGVRPHNAGFQKAQAAPKFQASRVKEAGVQAEVADHTLGEIPLISHVVEGERIFCIEECRIGAERFAKIRTQEPRGPVMADGIRRGGKMPRAIPIAARLSTAETEVIVDIIDATRSP